MNKNLLANLTNCITKYKDKIKYRNVFTVLALVVVLGTLYVFMRPAITLNEELLCEVEEHMHTDACYEEKFICEETDENKEKQECYEEKLVCEKEVHTHDDSCYGTSSDKESITYLTNIIDGLPTVDEMNSRIDSLATEEEKNEYSEKVIATATNAYAYYLKLEEKVQTKITNIDKLLEYEEENLIEAPEEPSNEVALFDTYTGYEVATVASNGITDDDIIEGADTSNIIEINLYDYFTSDDPATDVTEKDINYKYKNVSTKYPGFAQGGGPSKTYASIEKADFGFGSNITTDKKNATTAVKKEGTINASTQNEPLSGYIKNTLIDGYPAIADGDLSLEYLFNQDVEGYAIKQNTANINGLFQYDEFTGTYHFNSRENFAQFDADTNTFTLYKQMITPNFLQYPFGNFLPLNNIRTETTQTSLINKAHFADVVTWAREKAEVSDNDKYGDFDNLALRLEEFSELLDEAHDDEYGNTDWDAGYAATKYFEKAGLDVVIETEKLSNLYNIDFDEPTNFFFGVDMEMNFIQPKDGEVTVTDEETGETSKAPMVFEFSGDDDVYVYIDGILFLDLSGRHRHVSGTINFDEGMVYYYALDPDTGDTTGAPYKEVSFEDILKDIEGDKPELNADGTFKNYSSHNFKFYYMERGSGSGVMKMTFNFPLIEKNSVMVTKELDMNEAVLLGNPDFSFQILSANADGTKTENTFIPVGTKYDILDTTGKKVGDGTVKENGIFTLKAGQTAVFSGIAEDSGKYYVREILDESWVSQYDGITVDGKSTTVNNSLEKISEFVGYESDVKDISDGHTSFVYNNSVNANKSGELKIEKELESNNYESNDPDKEFKFLVTLDGVKLKSGTSYSVTGVDGTVSSKTVSDTEEGIIVLKAGEVASITGLFAGSKFEVTEQVAPLSGYQISYKVDGNAVDGSSAIGYINDSSVSVLVTNVESGEELTIPIYKTISNPDGESSSFEFDLVEIVSYEDQTKLSGGEEATTTITPSIEGDKIGQGESSFTIKYTQSDYEDGVSKKYYYKITEKNPGGNSIRYDSRVYIIEVTITNTKEDFDASISKIWIDGVEKEPQNIEFVNQILTKLTITKEVKGIVTGDALFDFRVKIKVNDVPLEGEYDYKLGTSTGKVTFTDGVATIKQRDSDGFGPVQLKDKESITIYLPYEATYKVTELTTDGFAVEYQVNSEDIQVGSGMESYVSLEKDNNNVKFINISGYELPDTGSSGRLIMVIIGLLLTIWFPVIHIGYMFNKRS